MTLKSATNRLDDLSQQRELPLTLLADRLDAVARLRNDAIAVVDGTADGRGVIGKYGVAQCQVDPEENSHRAAA